MGILNNVGKGLSNLSKEAQKTYDTKKLERRIKNYRREETELYISLGRSLYQTCGIVDKDEFDAIYHDLNIIHARMKQLDKQITNIWQRTEDEDAQAYTRLDRKESDLTITRTAEGIKLIRLCPACKIANNPDSDVCEHCNRPFSE